MSPQPPRIPPHQPRHHALRLCALRLALRLALELLHALHRVPDACARVEDGAVGPGGAGDFVARGEDGGVLVWGSATVARNTGEEGGACGGAQGGGFAEGGGAGVGVEVGLERDDVLKREYFVWVVCTEARDSALRRRPKKNLLRTEAASWSGWVDGRFVAPLPSRHHLALLFLARYFLTLRPMTAPTGDGTRRCVFGPVIFSSDMSLGFSTSFSARGTWATAPRRCSRSDSRVLAATTVR
ncbi:hypothetical protein B0H14DRAFT_814572 [Mycena olivaceomarginata]|nr:hypothetical protein B0H14DRAFT_814572 [Mycena olivaceomarginata]